MLKKTAQKGFTIVELLIVIVVIGILAALVLNTFSGVQQRARNTERQTDINALATQLEAYYNGDGNGKYLTFAQLSNSTVSNVTALLKGLDAGALQAPGGSANSVTNTATPTIAQYGYVPAPTGCDNSTTNCSSYSLYYRPEPSTTTPVEKKSLNQ